MRIIFIAKCITLAMFIFRVSNAAEVVEVQKVDFPKSWYEEAKNIAKIVPTNIPAGSNEHNIIMRIFQHSFQSFLKSDPVRNSKVGKSVQKAAAAVRPDVRLIQPTPENPTSLMAKFFLPEKRIDLIFTSAYIDGDINYFLSDQRLVTNLKHKMSETVNVNLQHETVVPDNSHKLVANFNWRF